MPPVEKSNPGFRTAKSDCYSPLCDKKLEEQKVPPCATCGKPSVGGVIESMADVHPQGEPILELTFLCRPCARDAHFAVNAVSIYPHYEIMRQITKSRLRLRRLSRDRAMARVRRDMGNGPA